MLGCGAHLVMLHRTHTGGFTGDEMLAFDHLQAEKDLEHSLDGYLLQTDVLVAHFPKKDLSAEETARILHGQDIACDQVFPDNVRLYDDQERFIGLAESTATGRLKPRRLVVSDEQ